MCGVLSRAVPDFGEKRMLACKSLRFRELIMGFLSTVSHVILLVIFDWAPIFIPVFMFISKRAACLTEQKNAAQCMICLKSYILRKHVLERKRIQFNVHIEQRQRSKKKSLSCSRSLSVNEPLLKHISVSASEKEIARRTAKKRRWFLNCAVYPD